MFLKKPKCKYFTKRMERQKNQTIGPLVSFRMDQKFLKDPCMIKLILMLIKYFQYINVVSLKVLAHSISFLTMIKKMKISRDNKQYCAATLTDFSKPFDSIPYDLLIAKLNASGFDQEALKRIHSYLIDRKKSVLC